MTGRFRIKQIQRYIECARAWHFAAEDGNGLGAGGVIRYFVVTGLPESSHETVLPPPPSVPQILLQPEAASLAAIYAKNSCRSFLFDAVNVPVLVPVV